MFLFNKNKLKVRSEEDKDEVKVFIEYHRIEQKDVFKANILKELIGDKLCLGILDSRLLFFEIQEEKISVEEIIEYLDFSKVVYKKFEIRKIPEVNVAGITIKKGTMKTDKDHIIGFLINKDNLKKIDKYANKLNIYYFIDKNGLDEDGMLNKLGENYEDVNELGKDFCYQIFDNNFNYQLVISSQSESSEKIKEIVDKCYSQLK